MGSVFLTDDTERRIAWLLVAVVVPAFRRVPLLLIGSAVLLLYLRFSGHEADAYPAIDWIRVRGMDLWPGFLQVVGMVLVLGCAPAILTRLRAVPLTILILGTILSAGWWIFPSHFNLEVVGSASRTGIPVVVSGRIEDRQWSRQVLPGRALDAWPRVIQSEWTLSAIGHGMSQRTYRERGTLRATAWGIQQPLTTFFLWLTALTSGVGIVTLGGVVFKGLIGRLAWWSIHGLALTLLLPPLANLGLRFLGLLGALPEARSDWGLAVLQAAVTLLVLFLVREAREQWSV